MLLFETDKKQKHLKHLFYEKNFIHYLYRALKKKRIKMQYKIYKKANICKKLSKQLPISDYEIFTDIKIYTDSILPFIISVDLKRDYSPHLNFKKIKEIEYSKVICQFQKFFTIKPLKIYPYYTNEHIISIFSKYTQIFDAIEKNLIKINSQLNAKMKFNISNENCEYEINFYKQTLKPLSISKYLKGTFLMKELEKLFGTYFFLQKYKIWGIWELKL